MLSLLCDSPWVDYFSKIFNNDEASVEAAKSIFSTVELVLWIIIAVVGLAAVIYSVYLGIQLARAEDQSKRDEAKKHLITVLIAIVVTLVLVVFFLYLLPMILNAFQPKASQQGEGG